MVLSTRNSLTSGSLGVALWISVSAWASASGWILSVSGFFNLTGYLLSLLVGFFLLQRFYPVSSHQIPKLRKIAKRFRRRLPFIFLILSILAFAGGALYAPNNYDFLTYRFPRVLHWSAEEHWHWIHAVNPRMNYSATGFEWLMAPLWDSFSTVRTYIADAQEFYQ